MRNLKKFLSVLLVIAMLAMAMVPAFAADTAISTDAQVCADIGMLIGQGNGVTSEYTATDLTRVQTAVLLLRLKGLEATAKNFTGTANFADVTGTEWFAPYTAYLKANPSLGFIGDGTNFNANDKISAQQYYKVLLTALGYAIPADYSYENTAAFAKSLGLDSVDGAKAVLTVNDLAAMTVETLKTAVKGGTATLATVLVDAGKIDAVKAEAAGIYSKDAAIASVKAVGVQSVLVTFNKAIDTTKATIALKKGTINTNIASKTFAADSKSVTLETSGNLSEGDYTVSVSGLTATALTATFTVKDEYVAKVELNSNNAVLDRSDAKIVTASFTMYNQYNQDITEDYYNTDMSYTSSKGSISPDDNGVLTITYASGFETDDKVSVTMLNSESGAFASAVLTVVDESQASSIAITSLYNADDESLDVDSTYADYKLVFEVKDQYGKNIVGTITNTAAAKIAKEDIILTSSNEDVAMVDESDFTVEEIDGTDMLVLPLTAPAAADIEAGTTTITAVSKFTGKLAKFDVVVKDTAKVDSFTMTAPEVAVAGEDVEIEVVAVDYYGDVITDPSNIRDGLDSLSVSGNSEIDDNYTVAGSDVNFEKNYVTGKTKLVINTDGITEKDTILVNAVTDSGKSVQLTINLKDPAEVSLVTGLDSDDVKTKILLNNTMTMDYKTLFVNDQYDREVDSADIFDLNSGDYIYTVESSDTDVVGLSGNVAVSSDVYAITINSDVITFTAKDTGSSKITVTAQKWDTDSGKYVDVDGSDYSFTLGVVENDDIASYKVEDIKKLYDPYVRSNNNGAAYRGDENYAQEVKVVGILSNGAEVAIPFSSGLYTLTETKGGVEVLDDTYLWVTTATSLKVDGDEETTPNVIVTIEGKDGAVVITKPYTISNSAPKIATMTLEDGVDTTVESDTVVSIDIADYTTVADLVADVITTEDQYGVEWTNEGAKYTIITTNYVDKNGDSIDNGKNVARESGDEFQVTAIAGSGLTKTFKVVIN